MNLLTGKIKLDFRSNEPLYLQIARRIEQLIAGNELKVEDQLPTVRELATELRINFNTVGRAYRLLDDTHLISTQRGRGTYVWEEPTEETMKQLRQQSLEELARQYLSEAWRLGYVLSDAVDEIKRLSMSITLDQIDENHENEDER